MADFQVRPGDLITAELWNALAAYIDSLQVRIALLEKGIGPGTDLIISSLDFANPLRVRDALTVFGKGFGTPGLIAILFDEETPLQTRPSEIVFQSDTRLVFKVPPLPSVPTQGRNTRLTIHNLSTQKSDFRDIQILPEISTLNGTMDVTWNEVSPNPFHASDGSVQLSAKLSLQATSGGTFLVTPTVSPASLSMKLIDDRGAELPAGQLIFAHGRDDKTLHVVLGLGGIADGTAFELSFTASAGDVLGLAVPLRGKIGTKVDLPDADMQLLLLGTVAGGGTLNGRKLSVPPIGSKMNFSLEHFKTPGDYNLSLSVTSASFSVQLAGPAAVSADGHSAVIKIAQSDIDGGATVPCDVLVKSVGADTTASMELSVSRTGSNIKNAQTFDLVKA